MQLTAQKPKLSLRQSQLLVVVLFGLLFLVIIIYTLSSTRSSERDGQGFAADITDQAGSVEDREAGLAVGDDLTEMAEGTDVADGIDDGYGAQRAAAFPSTHQPNTSVSFNQAGLLNFEALDWDLNRFQHQTLVQDITEQLDSYDWDQMWIRANSYEKRTDSGIDRYYLRISVGSVDFTQSDVGGNYVVRFVLTDNLVTQVTIL